MVYYIVIFTKKGLLTEKTFKNETNNFSKKQMEYNKDIYY